MTSPAWYLRRLSRMGPREVAGRAGDVLRKRRWRREFADPERPNPLPHREFAHFTLPEVPSAARARLVATAEELMAGRAAFFGVGREDMVAPDWLLDPKTGLRAPADTYAFDVPYRDEEAIGDVKQIWEPSRHQHLTVLAAAYALTGEDRYAGRVAEHLKSWWAANPPLSGVHWVSGIELGIRLISWVWVRRLLSGWPDAPGLFEHNPEALHQIWHHQRWLATFASHGSSANNHAVAEAAGQLAAASAFPWFTRSTGWRTEATRALDEHLRANTFGSGLNRELATEYHGLVLELGLAGALEAHAAGVTVPETTLLVLLRMTDALAAIVDGALHPPRQGDADDGHGLILDGAGTHRWASLLATGATLFDARPWWPTPPTPQPDVRTALLGSLAGKGFRVTAPRPARRPGHFADAGMTILRSRAMGGEVWCRCDAGPHGFLSIAAHAHADALSLEVRHDGVDILADPGTYCYHGQPAWRSYFRATLAHNTLELDGRDQSVSGGPFLWSQHAHTEIRTAEDDRWSAQHDGYATGKQPATHRRTVELAGAALGICDEVFADTPRHAVLAFHLGPDVHVRLEGSTAALIWPGHSATLDLPEELSWSAHRGELEPPLGWYSPGFGRREPAWALLGSGRIRGGDTLLTLLRFDR